ncbi:MAG: hypothetical protein IPK82_29820 [Polyangiaceae bacterium]|nr:hypothetical protein [Polyangiaceae bacterium]
MGDVISDLKTRYSIYVPKPLARINLGDWQKREGTSQSPKFGYAGVSIQTDSQLFVDVLKTTYIQARGGYNLQTTDLLQIAQKAVFLATPDNATVGSDGLMTLAAGAGQAPTWTLDHGDLIDVYPYNSLQLHYRVEEVQNGLFEFFRGKREREAPSDTTGLGGVVAALFLKKTKYSTRQNPKLEASLPPSTRFLTRALTGQNKKAPKKQKPRQTSKAGLSASQKHPGKSYLTATTLSGVNRVNALHRRTFLVN